MTAALVLLISYLLGSIPSAVCVGRWFHGIDVREHGSGNAGATNTFRVLGKKSGMVVLLVDVLKGALSSVIATQLLYDDPNLEVFQMISALICIVGHVFPVFAQFRGGKGVATSLGVYLGFHPLTALICIGVFVIVFILSKYVSLSSMTAAFMLPFISYFIMRQVDTHLILFNGLISLVVILAHRKNIYRLLHGEEQRMNFRTPKV